MAVDIHKLIEERGIDTMMQLVISPNQDYAVGLEALSRGIDPDTGHNVSPTEMIVNAEEEGLLQELEKLMFLRALETFKPLHNANPDLLLFMNMGSKFIEICRNNDFIESSITQFDIPFSSIFFDITAFDPRRLEAMKCFVDTYKEKGFYMSMDDLGEDYSNIDKLLYLSPDIVKINFRSLRRLENKTYVENMIKTLKFITESLGIIVVAKGIEDEQDVGFALKNGAQFMQGYYISKPVSLTTEALYTIKDRYRHLMEAHLVEEGSRGELTRLMTTKAYVIMNGIKEWLDDHRNQELEVDSEAIFNAYPMVENFWFLDEHGVQVGSNHVNQKDFMLKKTSMFQIYSEGTDFSSKDLFLQLYNTILNVWVTKPFKSILTNNQCVTSSIRLDYSCERAVICANINLDKINETLPSKVLIAKDGEDDFQIIVGE